MRTPAKPNKRAAGFRQPLSYLGERPISRACKPSAFLQVSVPPCVTTPFSYIFVDTRSPLYVVTDGAKHATDSASVNSVCNKITVSGSFKADSQN